MVLFTNKYEDLHISETYSIGKKNYMKYVYVGVCNGFHTKWVTKTKWDYRVDAVINNGYVEYKDSNGRKMLIIEDDEEEWSLY
jgi:hypothetical protein